MEKRHDDLYDSVPLGLYRSQPDGRIVEGNLTLARMLGFASREDLLRSNAADFYAQPGDRNQMIALLTREGAVRGFETRLRRANGTDVPVSVSANAVRDAAGNITHLEGWIVDVTERRSLEDQLAQAQKLESIGLLAGGIAHDFNNLLGAISVFGELAASDLPSGDPRLEDLSGIQDAVRRATTLTRQLLAFSRKQVLHPKVLDPNALIGELLKILTRLIGEDIEIVTHLDATAGLVRVDPSQLEQVLVNLAVNARDAMPAGGRLVILTGRTRLEAIQARERELVSKGEYVVISVSDNGHGMSREIQARVFEPFFSTKGTKGTGLGLATVLGIVRQSGGHIAVHSEPGKGTTFTILLPKTTAAADATGPVAEVAPTGGTETILFAEDDSAVRLGTKTLLSRLGYHVLATESAEEALARAEGYTGRIHLVVSDVVMSGMNGKELVEQIRRARPDMLALLVSGYAGDDITRRGIEELGIPLLEKPFSANDLARSIRAVLDTPRQAPA